MSIQAGAYCLEKTHGGLGMLLGGVPGVDPAKVVVLGGGVVGTNAAHIAVGMGADVWVLDRNVDALKSLWRLFVRSINTVYSTRDALERHVRQARKWPSTTCLSPGQSPPCRCECCAQVR